MHIWCKEWGVADTLASIERLNYVVQQDGITCVSNTSVLASSLAKSGLLAHAFDESYITHSYIYTFAVNP